jgi:tRNA nucleotidyltransferase (CCA-adding enzyme)
MAETGLLAVVLPELEQQLGVGQNKIPGDDLWAHTLRAVDAAPLDRPTVRLAALLHDIGKPATAAAGHFVGHDREGARLAREVLARLRYGKSEQDRVAFLVEQHMFSYEQAWTDAAVRRFIAKVGARGLEDLFELREADNVASGLPRDAGWLPELRRRVTEQLEADVALTLADLAINGDDLIAELGIKPGPEIGRILEDLLDRVLVDSDLNDRPTLLMLARSLLAERRP